MKLIFVIFIVVSLVGCNALQPKTTNEVANSFSGMTFESDSVDTGIFKYKNFITTSALAPIHLPGMYYHQPDGKSPLLSLGISANYSYVIQSKIPMKSQNGNDKTDAINKIVKTYNKLQQFQVKAASLQLKTQLGAIALSEISKAKKQPAWLPLIGSAIGVDAANMSDKEKASLAKGQIQKKISEIQKEYEINQTKINQLSNEIIDTSLDNQIYLAQWSSSSSLNGSLGWDQLLEASVKVETQKSGVMALGDIIVETVFPGMDYASAITCSVKWASEKMIKEVGLVTHSVFAKHKGTINQVNFASAVGANLNINLTQLSQFSDLKDILKKQVNINLGSGVVQLMKNINVAHNVTHKKIDFRFYPAEENERYIKERVNDIISGYHTVMTVRAHLDENVLAVLKGSPGAKDVECAELPKPIKTTQIDNSL